MPFAGFRDWDECLKEQQKKGMSKESAQKVCGALKRDYEQKQAAANENLVDCHKCGAKVPALFMDACPACQGRDLDDDIEEDD
jgi:hypothetical protein